MKKIITVFLIIFTVQYLSGDVFVKGININQEPEVIYIKFRAENKLLSKKLYAQVDYGREDLRKYAFDMYITEGESPKKKKVFYSVIEILNFMVKNGWEYIDSFLISKGKGGIYHFLMKKKDI